MTKEFRSMRLAELCDIFSGFAFRSQDLVASGIPVLKIGNIQNKLVSEACADHFPEALFVKKLDRYSLARGDTLVAMTGAGSVGKFGRMPWTGKRFLVNQRVGIIRPHSPICDPDFVYYSLSLEKYERTLYGYGMGAGQPNVSASQIGSLEISLPSVAIQRRIASILSAYDDLIENNTRRIAILEEMARRLYEEWFVRFRFPSHEGVRMVESELGLVPQGWVVATIGDAASYVNRGLSPKYDNAAACRVINQKCIRDQRLTLGAARRQSKSVPAGKLLQFGDVLINSTGVGTLGRVAQVQENLTNCTADSHVSIVRASDNCDLDYFGLSLLAQQAHFEAQGVGSTGQTELSRARISETSIVLPPLDVQQQFGKLVRPMRNLAIILQNKNINLSTTRDLLLPKLISGELDVSTLPEALAETI